MQNDERRNPYVALLHILAEVNSLHQINEILDKVMDIAMETLAAERGFILMRESNEKEDFQVVTARKISKESISDIRNLSSSTVNMVLENGESVLTYDALEDKRFAGAESIQLQKIHSIASVPLKIQSQVIGAIYMDNRSGVGKFTQESVDFLQAFAQQAVIAIENARLYEELQSENKLLRRQVHESSAFTGIVGRSKKIQDIFEIVTSVAGSDATVLVGGESGTGKELIAKAIHANSKRKEKPFVPVFCGSLSETLLESELWGHKKGSFTGASENKAGLFEEANGGTFFLDEIGDISKNIQTKLLRVLQEGEIKRVGENTLRKIDVRIIAATHRNLWEMVNKGEFREDLYYRLNVINIVMPPLRERREDVLLLAKHFLNMYSERNKKHVTGFTREAEKALMNYNWPGNIRELENTVERSVIMARSHMIAEEDLRLQKREESLEIGMSLKEIERLAVMKTLDAFDGNRTKAAEQLGVSRRWLQYQLKEWGEIDGNSGV